MKVLVIRFSSIGDIILTTPVLRVLKNRLEDEVHFLTKPSFRFLLEHNPHVDRIWEYSKNVIEELKKEKFDLIIDLHHNIRSKKATSGLHVPTYSVDKENYRKWLMVNFKSPYELPHIVDRYLSTYPPLVNDGYGLDYFPSPTVKHPTSSKTPEVIFGIGGQHYTKRMPASMWSNLAQQIQAEIAVVGGPEDAQEAALITGNHVESFAGTIGLDQTALLISSSKLVITHDTAVMHMAAAYQKPTFSIWGNTVPEFGMAAHFSKDASARTLSRQYVVGPACQPCSKIGFDVCPIGNFNCMKKQPISTIAKDVNDTLSGLGE